MKRLAVASVALIGIASLIGVGVARAQEKASTKAAVRAAMGSLDDYMVAFNGRDPKGWAATLNYPHVRIAGDAVRVWETEAEYADYMDFDAFAKRFGWDHSKWDKREVIQSSHNKVHVAVTFSRYNADDQKIATFDSFYVVTLKDGRWGTQARSSFAP